MADLKISQLNAITVLTPATDVLPVVDSGGVTKKITTNQILGSGGTATLASATITGDLTVDTSTLKVDSSNDNVGIGTTTPASYAFNDPVKLAIANTGTAGAGNTFTIASGSTGFGQIAFANGTSGTSRYNGYIKYSHSTNAMEFYTNAGSLQATLNASGLGVGVSPFYKFQSVGIAAATDASFNGSGGNLIGALLNSDVAGSGANPGVDLRRWTGTAFNHGTSYIATNSAGDTLFYNGAVASNTRATSLKMTLDASGNLLVGKSSAVATAVGIQFQPAGNSYHTLAASTNADTTLLVYSTGAAAYRFYVGMAGTVFATNTTISAISDARLKENVQDLDVGLDAILALKPRKFDWKEGKGKNIKGDRGFIAQEFETVFPNLIDEWADPAPEGEAPYKSVRQDLIPVLVKAIQELTARVQTLEAK